MAMLSWLSGWETTNKSSCCSAKYDEFDTRGLNVDNVGLLAPGNWAFLCSIIEKLNVTKCAVNEIPRSTRDDKGRGMRSAVALVMKMSNHVLFEALLRGMPVWVAETPQNAAFKKMLLDERDSLSVTWFPLNAAETLSTAAIRIAFSLDDHHNECAQRGGYRSLFVFGAPYASSMNAELAPLGFKKVDATDFGFVAVK